MAFIVVYDSCVLYPAPVRDLLLRIAISGIVRARWTDQILDETFRNIEANKPDLNPAALRRTRELMCNAVPDCLITEYDALIGGLNLPDPDDRHVLAAAIRANAQAIITFNLKDFPAAALQPYDIEAKHPDDFVMESMDISPGTVARIVAEQAEALKNPPTPLGVLLDTLREQGLIQTVARLREMFSLGSQGPSLTT